MRPLFFASLVLQPMMAFGQAAAKAPPFVRHTVEQLSQQTVALLAEARNSPNGLATVKFEDYPGHRTSLTARVKSGGPELHKNANDIFVVIGGEATQMVGGTLKDPTEVSPGELHGSTLEGAEGHSMRKGDVIHISPDVPHQTVLAPGKTFVYYVIKVDAVK